MKTSETIDTAEVPAGLNWLSERQREQPLPLSDDPLLNYCLQLEARIEWQSAEIEALRQMLRSEHDRHLKINGAERRLLRSWLRTKLGAG